MLKAIFSTLRFIILVLAGHKEIALENGALRQQLTILKKETAASETPASRSIVLDSPDDRSGNNGERHSSPYNPLLL